MTAFTLARDGAVLHGVDTGRGGLPLVFQHGLGGSEAQVAENVPDMPGVRRLTLDCRAQGRSSPGSARPFSIAMFAADVLAACDARGIGRFVAGGISMGAAVALHLAARHPGRVRALVLARPAWLFAPAPGNMRPHAEVAGLLRRHPPDRARALFAGGATAAALARQAPDNLASLLGFFDRPDPQVTAGLLGDIAADGPGVSRAEAAALRLPVLVLGHGVDHVHPLAGARELARAIPGARFAEIPPKATERAPHVAAFRSAVRAFVEDLALQDPAPEDADSGSPGRDDPRCGTALEDETIP